MDPDARARLDETMTQIAHQTGATLHVYHHPGRAARRVVLRDTRNDSRHPVRGRSTRRRRNTARDRPPHRARRQRVLRGRDHLLRLGLRDRARPGWDPVHPCWAARPATMCSTCWPPITTSTAGRLTIFCDALKSPPRSATGIANSPSARDRSTHPPGIREEIAAEQRVVVFVGLRTQPARVTEPRPRTEQHCSSSATLITHSAEG